jgi:S-adenosylmethionine-dependent methyltransferase
VSDSEKQRLATALRRTYFARQSDDYFETAQGRKDLEDHAFWRYEDCVKHIVPWVSRHGKLADHRVLEVGCGSGSSTAAFARYVRHVDAYEITEKNVDAARSRMEVLGIENVTFHLIDPRDLCSELERNHPDGVDIVLLYAVLEHQLIAERLETIQATWACLKPGGLMVVGDTPNRLVYVHHHTTDLPFFDMLPNDLALIVCQRSPRLHLRETMRRQMAVSREKAIETLDRWGRGVSFHEFEAVLGELRDLVVGDGYDEEILLRKNLQLEEELLRTFMVEKCSEVPVGFSRASLDVILRKPQ